MLYFTFYVFRFMFLMEALMSAYSDSDLPHPDSSDDEVHTFAPIIEFFLVIMLGLYKLAEFLTELATLPFTKAPAPQEG